MGGIKYFIFSLFLLVSSFAVGQNEEADKNEEKIESLKDQLLELDMMLNSYKTEQAKQEVILKESDLDPETKDYIKQVVESYTKTSLGNDSEISYIKGQLDYMRNSLDNLRNDVIKGDTESNMRIQQINSKMDEISSASDPSEITQLRAEIASLKARINLAENETGSSGSSDSYKNELIAQQQKEIELLKEEVGRLKQELETAKQQVRFVNSEELQKLKDQNLKYKLTVDRQQKELALLMEKVDILEEQVDERENLKELSSKIDVLTERTEEVEKLKFQAENQTSISETIKDLDILAFRNGNEERIDKLSKDVNDLKSLVASGKVVENSGDPMFLSNISGSYYVIVASRRSKEAAEMAQQDLMKKGYPTQIIQNSRKSWYHLTGQGAETRDEASEAAAELREKGFKGAWWMFKKTN